MHVVEIDFGKEEKKMNPFIVPKEGTPLACDAKFYTISEVAELTRWSEKTVQKLFNAPDFPSADFGRGKVVEAHALIEYFKTKHERSKDKYWN